MAWFSGTYNTLDNWVDSEDVVAAASLPALKSLMGESPTWRAAVMGLVNQVVSRNLIDKVGPSMDAASLHSLKSLLAGVLLPLEEIVFQGYRMRTEGFFRNMSKGTVASLIAGAIGPMLGNQMMGKKTSPP